MMQFVDLEYVEQCKTQSRVCFQNIPVQFVNFRTGKGKYFELVGDCLLNGLNLSLNNKQGTLSLF